MTTPALDLPACAATAWQATPDMPLRSLVAAGLVLLAAWAGSRRAFPGQRSFMVLALVMSAWLGFSITEHAAVDAACKGTVALLGWSAILAQPPLYALFIHQYLTSELQAPAPWRRALLAVPSVVMLVLVWTNGLHGLFYGDATALGPPIAGLPRLRYDYGPLFHVAVALGYLWTLAAATLVLRGWLGSRGTQRRHWGAMALMMAVPLAANAAYLGWGLRLMGADPTSTGFAVALVGFAWLMQRDGLFAVVPLARRLLFDELPDPVIVLDAAGRLAEVNPAAAALGGPPLLDRPLAEWSPLGPALAQHLAAGAGGELALGEPARLYEVQRRELGSHGQSIGALIQLHDVSARHQAHAEAVRSLSARQVELERATALQALLREQAMHDALTGLLNRRALQEQHSQEQLARRSSDAAATPPLALVLMDLDHFKRINDTHGHAAGDAVLRDFAVALRSGLRSGDTLARIGGEEFALLMPGATADQATRRVQGLRDIVARWDLGSLGEAVTFSAGVAVAAPGRESLEALLDAADRALYQAKRAGRDRTVVAD